MTVTLTATHHTGLGVSDMEAAMRWFARHFGFATEAEWTSGDMRIAVVGAGGVRVELFEKPGADEGPDETLPLAEHFGRRGWKHVAFTVDDLSSALDRLRADGVEVMVEASEAPGGFRYAFLRGPDGAPVELVEPG